MNTNWIERIAHIIRYIRRKSRGVNAVILTVFVIAVVNIIPQQSWIIIFLAMALFHRRSPVLLPRHARAVRHLKNAIKYVKQGDNINALSSLIAANEAFPNNVLQDLIKDFSQYNDISEYSELSVIEKEIAKTKDEKDLKILQELKKTLEYIFDHSKKLAEINEKVSQLEKELSQAPETYRDELMSIIQRYKSLRQLEEAKINFYRQAKKELWNLHREYLFRNKIEKERQELSNLESQYLSDSVRESLEADEKTSFIDFQSLYLEELSRYANEIDNISSEDLFEEIKKEFEEKKQQIKNKK